MAQFETAWLRAVNDGIPLFVIVALGGWHWSGLLAASLLWWIQTAWKERRLEIPSGGPGLLGGVFVLVVSAALSPRPSGLAWLGLLQWLSLLSGIFFLQDVFRRRHAAAGSLLWGLLGLGSVSMLLWSRQVVSGYSEWWSLRADGLPWFPFRIRLFGSHGSTQSAVWLVIVLLVGVYWGLPRLKGPRRIFGCAWLIWCSILLGFCDSRLAMAGAFAGVVFAGVAGAPSGFASVLLLIPNTIWWGRDFLHPSRILEGGGVDQGRVQLVLALAVPALLWLGKRCRWCGNGVLWAVGVISLGFSVLALPLVDTLGEAGWATGRLQFWRVGIDAFAASPIWGCGAWSFPWLYSLRIDWSREFLAMHSHNWVLECLVSGGVLLLGAFVWMFLSSFRRGISDELPPVIPVIGIVLAISMVFDSPLASPQVLLAAAVVGGWAMARQGITVGMQIRKVWILVPLGLVVPMSYVTEGLAGKAGLAQAGSIPEPRERAERILEAVPDPPSDPQWLREQLWARTTLNASRRDSLANLIQSWDSLIALEPTYSPNQLNRDYCAYRAGLPNRLGKQLDSLGGRGWARGFVPTISPRWRRWYPTDSAAYWLNRAEAWRELGDTSRLRWVRRWFQENAQPHSCAEVQWTTALGQKVRIASEGKQDLLYGAAGTRGVYVPELEAIVTARCLSNFRNPH